MTHPEFLKLPNAPVWDYHIWTPLLAERGDMVPFYPLKTVEPEIPVENLQGEATASLRIVEHLNGWYGIVDQNDKPIGPRIRGLENTKQQLDIFLKKLKSKVK